MANKIYGYNVIVSKYYKCIAYLYVSLLIWTIVINFKWDLNLSFDFLFAYTSKVALLWRFLIIWEGWFVSNKFWDRALPDWFWPDWFCGTRIKLISISTHSFTQSHLLYRVWRLCEKYRIVMNHPFIWIPVSFIEYIIVNPI